MLVYVTPMRDRGAILPKWRTAFWRAVQGRLVIRDFQDPLGLRWLRRAVLEDPSTGKELNSPPALLDASVVRWETDYLVITGFERLPADIGERLFDFQQSWYVTFEASDS